MNFHYIASQPNGKVIEANIAANSPAEVLEILASKGLKPISLKAVKGVEEGDRWRVFGQRINVEDKVFLTKYLSLMLKVGTDLFRAIDILVEDLEKPAMKALLIEVRGNLEKGQPFYLTFSKYPKYFSPVFVNLIKAGEASGNLDQIFDKLSVSLQKEQELRQRIKSALTYPVILLIASLIMVFSLVTFALPKIANVFLSSGIKPPPFSMVVFTVGLFLNNYMLYILALVIALGFAIWYFIFRTTSGKRIAYRFFIKLPIVKDVLKKMALQRFASILSSLIGAGLPILDALEITAEAVGFEEIKDSLIRVSREGVVKGIGIGEAFRRESIFPRVVVNLMAISEKAGHIEDVLDVLSNFYEAEIDSSIKIMVSFLEPALLLGIGIAIGTIALAIIVPVYQLVGSF